MSTKKCRTCGEMKELSEYYKHKRMFDGHLNICKECTKKRVMKHRGNNIEAIREYDRKRGRTEERKKKCRNYIRSNPEKYKETRRNWREKNFEKHKEQADNNLEKVRKKTKEYRKANPEKYKAHNKVNNAIRSGKLIKPKYCEHCGVETRLDGHHEDHTKPLDVVWLCRDCHMKRHRKYNDDF